MRNLTNPLIYAGVAFALVLAAGTCRADVLINFDDVVGSEVDITNRYAGQGVRLNAIANPFPLTGAFPAPATLPTIFGGVTTWTQGFASATSAPQVAVSAPTAQTGQAGNGGILITFSFDVDRVSLVGNDLGTGATAADDESVTLTAYDVLGNRIGQTFSNTNLATGFDRTPASISFAGMRYVAFNYTDTQFGFYAIDDLSFRQSVAIPEPGPLALAVVGGSAVVGAAALRRRHRAA